MGLHLNKPKMNAKHKLKEVTIPDGVQQRPIAHIRWQKRLPFSKTTLQRLVIGSDRHAVPLIAHRVILAGKIGAPDKSLALAQAAPHDVAEVTMTVLNDSLLAISWLPKMRYMPMWSDRHRTAVGKVVEVDGTRLRVLFGTGSRNPPLSWRTTFVNRLWPLRIPAMPPGAAIDIKSNTLQGWVDLATGEVDFEFDSEFGNMMGGADKTSGAPLQVSSRMTSEALEGNIFRSVGQRVQQDGSAKLVCISLVPATSDKGQTWFLQLPTDALSILRVKFGFVLKGDATPVNN